MNETIIPALWIRALLLLTAVLMGACSHTRTPESPTPETSSTPTAASTESPSAPVQSESPQNPCLTRCQQAENPEGCQIRCDIWACIEECKRNGGEEPACRADCGARPRPDGTDDCRTQCGMSARQAHAACMSTEGSDAETCKQSARAAHAQCVKENCGKEDPESP